jgi:hypothetical protein
MHGLLQWRPDGRRRPVRIDRVPYDGVDIPSVKKLAVVTLTGEDVMLLDPVVSPTSVASGAHTSNWATAHRMIDLARQRLGLSPEELRIASWGFGGNANLGELSAFLQGRGTLGEPDYNSVVAAVNDRFTELGLSPSLPYSEDYAHRVSGSVRNPS